MSAHEKLTKPSCDTCKYATYSWTKYAVCARYPNAIATDENHPGWCGEYKEKEIDDKTVDSDYVDKEGR